MSCKDYENDFLAYLDRRLDSPAVAKLDSHFKSCPACRREVDALRATWKQLGYYPGRNVSGQLPARMVEAAWLQLQIEKRWTHKLRRHLPIIASAAVVLLVLGVTMLLGPGHLVHGTNPMDGLTAEEQAVVQNLDLYENLDTVQNLDVLEDDQVVEYLHLVSSMTDEDF